MDFTTARTGSSITKLNSLFFPPLAQVHGQKSKFLLKILSWKKLLIPTVTVSRKKLLKLVGHWPFLLEFPRPV